MKHKVSPNESGVVILSKKIQLCDGCYYNLDDDVCMNHSYFHGFDCDGNLLHFDTYGKKIKWIRQQSELCRSGCSGYRSCNFLCEQKRTD